MCESLWSKKGVSTVSLSAGDPGSDEEGASSGIMSGRKFERRMLGEGMAKVERGRSQERHKEIGI